MKKKVTGTVGDNFGIGALAGIECNRTENEKKSNNIQNSIVRKLIFKTVLSLAVV